ncbi:MAG: NAD(P)H-dependent glycerol-3-phosphate dehydrogenase [Kiritimatiellia bacterium]
MTDKAVVIGDGGWGTALALLLTGNGASTTIWSAFPEHVEEFTEKRENTFFLPGVPLPEEIRITHDRLEAVDGASLAILAVPSKYFASVAASFKDILPDQCRVLTVAKGLAPETFQRMSQVAERALDKKPVAALSGPSHAEEVARKVPTAVVAASPDTEYCRWIQKLLTNERFRVYTSPDIVGVELGGALKNVIALAVGIGDGLGFGDNTRGALITRGLAEISRLGCALGGKPETFAGLSGMGDLIATCTGRYSRNRHVGERLGKGEKLADIQAAMKQVAEGVDNCDAAHSLAGREGLEMPITDQVHALLRRGADPLDAVRLLMHREPKPE